MPAPPVIGADILRPMQGEPGGGAVDRLAADWDLGYLARGSPGPARRFVGTLLSQDTSSASRTPNCDAAFPPIIRAISSSGTPPPRSVAIASTALVVS